tara:strand:- start:4728 stop:5915 length:1188 start_codon:yes stop_codon:yes gene_type:complete
MSGIATSGAGDVKLDGDPNAFTGTNTYDVNRPTSTLTSTPAATDFITKQDGENLFTSSTGDALLAGANAFTGTNTFNSNRPTSTLTSTIAATDFITKQNADTLYTNNTGDAVLAGANAFTGTNTFNTNRPTSTLTSTIAATDFITKQNADTLYTNNTGDAVLSGANAFTGTNTFNTNRPTSTLATTPAATDFITKQNADALYGGGEIQQTGYENEFGDSFSYAVSSGNPNFGGNSQGNTFGGRMSNTLNADIEIPTGHSGKVLVTFNVSGDWSNSNYDKGVILGRATLQADGTTFTYDKLITATPSSTRGLFISNFLSSYQSSSDDSTMEQSSGAIMDDTITAGNTYRYTPILVNSSSSSGSHTFKLNRVISSRTEIRYERACSSVTAQLVNISS